MSQHGRPQVSDRNEWARSEVVRISRALTLGELSFIEGVRGISALKYALVGDAQDEDLTLFVAIESESDHLPNAGAKAISSAGWLQYSAREETALEQLHGQKVRVACQRLIGRFS
jgi:hypothetical protein